MSEHEVKLTSEEPTSDTWDLHVWLREHGGAIEEFDWDSIHDFVAAFLRPRLADAEARAEAAEATLRLVRNEARSLAAAYDSHPDAMHTGRTVADDLDHVAAIEALRGDQ